MDTDDDYSVEEYLDETQKAQPNDIILEQKMMTKNEDETIVPSTSSTVNEMKKVLPSSIVIKKVKTPMVSMLTKKVVLYPSDYVPSVQRETVQKFSKRNTYPFSFFDIVEMNKFPFYSGLMRIKFEDLLEKLLTYFGTDHCVTYLSNSDQLLLTLMMYRFKFDLHVVSKVFRIDKTSTLRVFYYWTSILNKYLKSIPFWKLLEYSKCTQKLIVLHVCTVNITQNKQFQLEAEENQSLSSSKVEHNGDKIKYLVAVTDNGHVLFCSDALSESFSENNVIRSSRVVEKFSDGDTVLSSEVMHIDDLLEIQGIKIQTSLPVSSEESNEETIIQATHNISKSLRYSLNTIPSYLLPLADEIIYNMNLISSFKSVVMKCCT